MAYPVPDHITVDMATIGLLTFTVLSALGVVWVLRKLIKFTNRS